MSEIKALIEELRARRGIASIQNARLMERAADALEALSHMEGWRPISEAQPSGKVLSTRYDVDDGQWNAAVVSTPICYPYTHWMPLPPSPTGGEE